MCGSHHGRQRGFGARGFGFRGRGFPSREEWLERLRAYRQQLEDDLKNVQDLIDQLGSGEQPVSQV